MTGVQTCALPIFKDYIKKNIDHGVIGAATLYENNVGNSKISNDLVQESCFAILVHKCFLHDKLNLNISNNKYLFAQLLCLIDSFQAWGRESQYQNIHDGTSIEKVVLRDINLTRNDKLNLNLKIDYLPFNYLSPSDTRLLTIDVPKLKDIIRNLYDELENIGIVKNSNGQYSWQDINLNFTYMIQGKSMNI